MGLVGRDGTRVLPHTRRLSEILQRGAAEGEAGMAEPDAAPQKSGAGCIAGPKKRLHPRTLWCACRRGAGARTPPARRFAWGRRSAAARLPACLRQGRGSRRRFRFGRWGLCCWRLTPRLAGCRFGRLRCWSCLPSLARGRRPHRRRDC